MNEDLILEKLFTPLFNLELEHPLIMGAGVAKHIKGPEGLEGFLAKANASMLIGGTFTLERRDGNSGEVCWTDAQNSFYLNRMGLPNKGLIEISENLKEVTAQADRKDKFIGISVAAAIAENDTKTYADHFEILTTKAFENGAHLVELNLSCPNTENEIIAFNPDNIDKILERLDKILDLDQHNVSVKLAPYSNSKLLQTVADIINNHKAAKGITTMNTFPNALAFQNKKTVITSGDGLAGLSGPAVLPIALGQVAQFRRYLSKDKYIIGGGGVTNLQDILDMLQAGASAVFLVSAVLNHKPRIFDQLLTDLIDYYSSDEES